MNIHPFTSYFDVHQGYKVLTHCHLNIPTFSGHEILRLRDFKTQQVTPNQLPLRSLRRVLTWLGVEAAKGWHQGWHRWAAWSSHITWDILMGLWWIMVNHNILEAAMFMVISMVISPGKCKVTYWYMFFSGWHALSMGNLQLIWFTCWCGPYRNPSVSVFH